MVDGVHCDTSPIVDKGSTSVHISSTLPTVKEEAPPVHEVSAPPDGGTRAWLVMLGSFFCNGILFGVFNSYSVFYERFYDNLVAKNETNAASNAALVGALAMGTTFFVSPVSGVLTDYMGLRLITFMGGAIASTGMFLASFCVDHIEALWMTFGVMYGLGGAMAYTPSLAILGHYFCRYLGVVNGFVTAGSSIFTIFMPYVLDGIIKSVGIEWALRFLAVMSAFIMLIAIIFKPVQETKRKVAFMDALNLSVWRNSKYLIWTITIALSLFGYFVPYIFMKKFVDASDFTPTHIVDGKLPVICIGITSGAGRLIFGYVADRPGVSRIRLQQLSFLVIGVLTILLPFSAGGSFYWLLIIALAMGLFDGCFISLLGPIAFDICGKEGATQAIGFLLGMCAIPLTIGPYVAGQIFEMNHSYTSMLLAAGVPPLIGCVAMFAIGCVKQNSTLINTVRRKARETDALRTGVEIDDQNVKVIGRDQQHVSKSLD